MERDDVGDHVEAAGVQRGHVVAQCGTTYVRVRTLAREVSRASMTRVGGECGEGHLDLG